MIYFKLFGESFLFALEALRVNRLRTLLSLLGITIGIFTIVTIFSGVDYLKNYLKDSVNKLGSNIIYVEKWQWGVGGGDDYPWWKYYQRPQPSLNDFKALQDGLKNKEVLTYSVDLQGKTLKQESNRVEDVNISGVSHDADKTQTLNFALGRFFTEEECNSGKNVCILGADVANGLFPNQSIPLGREITLMGRKATVVGVFAKAGSDIFGLSTDKQIFVPLNYARLFTNIKSENAGQVIRIKGPKELNFDAMQAEVRTILRGSRRLKPNQEDNFSLNNPSIISTSFESLYQTMDKTGWFIGIFSILVGGFGIANIMFVSVKERTPIIGIQKSLGAKNYFILLQFLVESVMLCLLGGAMGILIAYGITKVISSLFHFDLAMSMENISLAIFLSVLIGIVSGFWPAYRASKMDPVEAIRS